MYKSSKTHYLSSDNFENQKQQQTRNQPITNSMKAKGINKVVTPKVKSMGSICNKRGFATNLVP